MNGFASNGLADRPSGQEGNLNRKVNQTRHTALDKQKKCYLAR